MPSPNMPTPDTALVYPGTGMFEGTNLSEGRGTTRPFELVGAPYVDYRWAERLAALDLPGVGFREAYFTPTFSKHVDTVCGGVQVHVTDAVRNRPHARGRGDARRREEALPRASPGATTATTRRAPTGSTSCPARPVCASR